jgi:hypothetical protein
MTPGKGIQESGKEPHHHEGDANPHLFASPRMAAKIVRNIAAQLSEIDPPNRRVYLDNAERAAAKLEKPKELKVHGENRKDWLDGDSQGGFNLHLRWETDENLVKDQPNLWEMTFFLAKESPAEKCTVDVTPRRCQKFKLLPGEKLSWTNTSSADGKVVQSGTAAADRWGMVTLERIIVSKGKNRIAITRPD